MTSLPPVVHTNLIPYTSHSSRNSYRVVGSAPLTHPGQSPINMLYAGTLSLGRVKAGWDRRAV